MLDALRACLDEPAGRYRSLRDARDYDSYLATPAHRSDEEILTEPVLAAIIERVLGFPSDAYFPQLGRSGLKPDFTPIDLVAHSFVLDAKSSDHALAPHEPQIRRYITQRSLDYGVLFNLRELRVYRRGRRGHDATLSFQLEPLWRLARGEALPSTELTAFEAFCERFGYREMAVNDQIRHVRNQTSWAARLRAREPVEVDVDFLTERLRALARLLVADAASQVERLENTLMLRPGRKPALQRELESLALDISPGVDISALPSTIGGWRERDGLAGRAWRQYLLRVAYLALTRILLYRAWEDVEFVDDYLYDGGFGVAYDRLSHNVQRVLQEAFLHGAERYRWLYGDDNNYDWFRPREAALVEVLYSLAPVPLGRLDADVLGDLYASYVDEIDRDRLGQFYTPRAVVRFMLDRAGFDGADGVFLIEGDRRRPRRVFDFATGSGGFLVEAARRIIDEGGIAEDDVRGLREALGATVHGLVGGEISPFPYYLTEVNLLLQVSRLLGRLNLADESAHTFTLSVLHIDSLLARRGFDESLDLDPAHRADRADLMVDERFGLVPLDGDKQEAFRALREGGGFDLVIGNPPYVAEANNKPLFDRLRAIPAWAGTYRGKTDYLYYFLLLAAEKVRPGGRLCVITPAGWMNAGAADFLRERLAADLRLDELFLFGSYRLFTPRHGQAARRRVPTPTVESAILLATKVAAPKSHSLRIVALEDELAAARVLSEDPEAKTPDRDRLLDEMARRIKGRPGRRDGIHVLRVKQAELRSERPWPVKHSAVDVPTRVVAHLQAQLDTMGSVEQLECSWHVFQGIQTGADAYTRRIQKRLTPDQVRQLAEAGAEIGDPILELPAGAETTPPWSDYPEVLARSPESRALLYGAIDDEDFASLVVLGNERPPTPILDALTPWRPLLESRADIVANRGRKPWWAAHRARDHRLLRARR